MSFLLPAQDEITRRRRGKWIVLAFVAMALIAATAIWGRSAWAKIHARKLTAEAEAYLAQGRSDAALERARHAFKNGARDARTLKLLLSLQGKSGDPQAFNSWGLLARSQNLSHEDRRELLRWAIAWGQADWADVQWAALQDENPVPVESLRLGAAYFDLRGDPQRAVHYARETVAQRPDDIETRVLLGRVLLRHGSPTDRALGRQLLIEQSTRPDQFGLQVLRALAASGELLPFEARECALRLEGHPARQKSDDLAALDLNMQFTPYKKAAILSDGAREFVRSGGDPAHAGRWLLNHQAYDLVLEVVSLERAQERAELGLVRLDALCALKRWNEVEGTLDRHPEIIPEFERSLLLARASSALGQSRLTELHWTQALQHAQKEPARLLTLSSFATGEGALAVAERALRVLAEQKPFSRKAFVELLRLKETQGEISAIRELLLEMRNRFPNDPAVENDLAYLDLLEEKEIEKAVKIAEKLVRERPEFLACRVTLALGRLRQDRPEEARSLLDVASPSQWEEANAAQRAIYVAVLARTGSGEQARTLGRRLAAEKLRPEERRMVSEVLD